MKLHIAKKPEIVASCCNRVFRVFVGPLPFCEVIQLVPWVAISLIFMAVFLFLLSRLIFGYICGQCSVMMFLCLGVFFIAGTGVCFWSVKTLMMEILPYSAELNIDDRIMIYGNKLWRRRCQLSGELVLLVEPSYLKGAWGFQMRIVSNGRKCLLLPGVIVGSYADAISKSRKLSAKIQECMPFVRIEESRYWRWH